MIIKYDSVKSRLLNLTAGTQNIRGKKKSNTELKKKKTPPQQNITTKPQKTRRKDFEAPEIF